MKCFESLGVSSRMKIYNYLKESGENPVGEVVKKMKLTQPTVSYHLKEMKKIGLLKSYKQGKEVHYSINKSCPFGSVGCTLWQ